VRKTTIRMTAVTLGLLVLAGCGTSSTYGGSTSGASSSSAGGTAGSAGGTAGAVLRTADSALGKIVVAGSGRTVYVFDKDTAAAGTSSCTGACLQKGPAVPAGAADPAVDGVTGKVATITRDDGTRQVTLGGRPLYTYAGDSDAGQVTGQGVQGVWWVVAADGAKVTAAPGSAPAAIPGY
jgi:predicted lipoprotein with Yx(FWY)xxD motif